MANYQDFTLELKVKADLDAAKAKVDGLNKSVKGLGTQGNAVSAAMGAASRQIELAGLSSGQAAQAMRLLPAQITDIVTGLASGQKPFLVAIQQGGQLRDSFGGLSNILKGFAQVITPARIGIGLLAGAVIGLGTELIHGYLQAQKFESALIATGDYAGKTGSQLSDLASRIGASTGDFGDASQAVLLLAQSGKVAGDALDDAARAAVSMSALTGEAIDKSVQAVIALGDDPVKAVRKLDEQYHFLTTATYAQIQALQEQGDVLGASALAQKTVADAMEDRARRSEQNLGVLQRGWHALTGEIKEGLNAIQSIGASSISAQLDVLYAKRGAAENLKDNSLFGGIPGVDSLADKRIASIDAQIAALKDLQSQEVANSKTEAQNRQVQEEGNKGLDFFVSEQAKYASAAKKYRDEIEAINKSADAQIAAMPGKAVAINAARDELLRATVSAYAKSLGGAASGRIGSSRASSGAADREAAAQEKAAAAAQEGLRQSLIQMQAALDPTAAAWAKYNEAVQKADEQAATAKLAHDANADAIDGERNAVIALAAKQRDAAIAAQSNKYSVAPAPKYQGVDAAVSGPAGELIKNLQFQQQLNAWHEQALKDNETFRQEDIANEQRAADAKLKIEQDFAAQSAAVDEARRRLTLSTAVAGFGALANAAKAAYGEQSKQYRIAFALQKAAALAQAILAIQTSIAESSKIGFPWNIVTIAGAVAQGVSVLATINSTDLGGYATGGRISGPGSGTSDSVLMWGSNGENVITASATNYYGQSFMDALNAKQLPRFPAYAEGGFVGAMASTRATPTPDFDGIAQRSGGGSAPSPQINQRIVVGLDSSALDDWAASSSFEKSVKVVIGRNPSFIRQAVR